MARVRRGRCQDRRVPLTVRLAIPADAAAIARVHVLAWQVAYRGVIAQETLDGLEIGEKAASWERQLCSPPQGSRITVCEDRGRVVAWSTHGPRRVPEVDPLIEPEGELYGLYAEPCAWGAGAGPALMQDFLEYSDARWKTSVVMVLSANPRARSFYARSGFHTVRDGLPLSGHPEATQALMRRWRPGAAHAGPA